MFYTVTVIEMKEEKCEKFVIFVQVTDVRAPMKLDILENIIHDFMVKLPGAQIHFVWINNGPFNLGSFEQIIDIQKEYSYMNCKLCNLLQTDVLLPQTELLNFCKENRFIVVDISTDKQNDKLDLVYPNNRAHLHSLFIDVSGNVFSFNMWDRRKGSKLGKIGSDAFYQIIISMTIEETMTRMRERQREKEEKMIENKRRRVTRTFQLWPPKIETDIIEKKEVTPIPLVYRKQSDSSALCGGGTSLFNLDIGYKKKQRKDIEFRSENKKEKRKKPGSS